MEPFVIRVTGKAEIPHPAERAKINVVVASSGNNKAAVSDEVLTTAKHIEDLLRELSPEGADNDASPLSHWSKTSLSATSHVPYIKHVAQAREYNSSINFNIRFKEFRALGAFGAKLSALSHVEVNNIQWILTSETEKSYQAQLRKQAAAEALAKAKDYCDVLGCTNVRPVLLEEGQNNTHSPWVNRSLFGAQQPQMQMQMPYSKRPGGGTAEDMVENREQRDESPLEFKPEEVRMNMEVTVKFHAE